MSWVTNFFTSSIGKKLIMSLTGLFLISFLLVHLLGNLQLLINDGGKSFNEYAYFMTQNPLIKTISYGLYFFILLHAYVGIALWAKNRAAKGTKYAVQTSREFTWAARNMAILGTLVLAFLFLHMGDFWFKMKFTDSLPMVTSDSGVQIKDLYSRVSAAFSELWIVVAYLVGLFALGVHLWHGFESAFQTLGIRHKKYTPVIELVGRAFSVIIPILYAIIPIAHYMK